MRNVNVLKSGWSFRRNINHDWEDIRIPHDWAINGPFDMNNDLQITQVVNDSELSETPHFGRTGGLPHVGKGYYRRIFKTGAVAGKAFYLEFDGVMSNSTILVNGIKAGGRPYGYSSFVIDITEFVKEYEDNLIEVEAENLPYSSRWYPGAGIYREVRLYELDRRHIRPWGIWVETQILSDAGAEFCVRVECSGCDGSEDVEIRIIDPDDNVVANAEAENGIAKIVLKDYAAWDINNPCLYKVAAGIRYCGEITDEAVQRFGFRTLTFDPEKGMALNSRTLKFKGVCLHHDQGPLGAAFSIPAARRQLNLLQSIGCNAIRFCHNPPAPAFLDLCDEMGFLAIDEAYDCWQIAKIKRDYHILFDEWGERDLTDMIRRDRNHPSIIMWSIGNEMIEQTEPEGWKLAVKLRDLCHRIDPERPVTAGLSFGDDALDKGMAAVIDIPGWNYKPQRYEEYHRRLPLLPQYGSETASTVSSRGVYHLPVTHGNIRHDNLHASSYDLEYPAWASTPDTEFFYQDKCPWIMGEFVWTGFDYLGEPTPYNRDWPAHSSYFGIFDLAGLPKDRAFLYKARWTEQPVLHLLPHWNWDGYEGKNVPVHCYTSCDTVELFLNGRSLGRRTGSSFRFVWDDVIYEPGELKAAALDADGNELLTCRRITSGESASLSLCADKESVGNDGDDLVFVTVSILDSNGIVQPLANNLISFKVDGDAEIAGVANGDSTCIEGFQSSEIHAFSGFCVIILRSLPGGRGTIRLHAESHGLRSANIIIPLVWSSSSEAVQ